MRVFVPQVRRLLTVLLLAIAPPVVAQARPTAQSSLLEAEQAAAAAVYAQGIRQGLETVLAEDAVGVFEGAPLVYGRTRIGALLARQTALGRLQVQRLPVYLEVSEDGTFGTTTGASIIRRQGQAPDAAATFGHYLLVWRRANADSPWRVVAVLENGLIGEGEFQPSPDPDNGPVPLLSGPTRLMAEADLAFARLAGDSGAHVAFGTYAAPHAITMPGERPVLVGPAAIRASMSTPARMESVWSWRPVYGGAAARGDFGWTAGVATIKSSRAADASVYEGKYLTVWQRQEDGSLRFLLDSGNGGN